jgi:AmmeMemoRadiSam system protein B
VAAWTYAALKGHKYSRVVVVIAPSHYVAFDFTSVYDGDAYDHAAWNQVPCRQGIRAPAGEDELHLSSLSDKGHQAHIRTRREHSVEVELPWLQNGSRQLRAGADCDG